MWNSDAPLQLLKSMPTKLSLDNLKEIQAIIDKDKYVNSRQRNRDLCGSYAPFCDICNPDLLYPCAVAYVMMKQEEGMQVEMQPTLKSEAPPEHREAAASVAAADETTEVIESNEAEFEDDDYIEVPQRKANVKIRIAVAKRKRK